MILDEQIRHLAQLFGIEAHASSENQLFLLQAMGVLPETLDMNDKNSVFNNSMMIKDIIEEQRDAEYKNVVHQVSVMRKNRVEELVIRPEYRQRGMGGSTTTNQTKTEDQTK